VPNNVYITILPYYVLYTVLLFSVDMVLWSGGGRGLASAGETRGAERDVPEIDAAVGDEFDLTGIY